MQLTAFAVLLLALAVIKQRCIPAGGPFWIGGELPVFMVKPHAPNQEVRTVTVRYEYMYRATPDIHIYAHTQTLFCIIYNKLHYINITYFNINNIILIKNKKYILKQPK